MHACNIKFVGINVRGACLISENHEHLYPRNIAIIRFRNVPLSPYSVWLLSWMLMLTAQLRRSELFRNRYFFYVIKYVVAIDTASVGFQLSSSSPRRTKMARMWVSDCFTYIHVRYSLYCCCCVVWAWADCCWLCQIPERKMRYTSPAWRGAFSWGGLTL